MRLRRNNVGRLPFDAASPAVPRPVPGFPALSAMADAAPARTPVISCSLCTISGPIGTSPITNPVSCPPTTTGIAARMTTSTCPGPSGEGSAMVPARNPSRVSHAGTAVGAGMCSHGPTATGSPRPAGTGTWTSDSTR
jgi:hypothetical protein